jgi:hypothetical protein
VLRVDFGSAGIVVRDFEPKVDGVEP